MILVFSPLNTSSFLLIHYISLSWMKAAIATVSRNPLGLPCFHLNVIPPLTDGSFGGNSTDGNYMAYIPSFFSPMTMADMTNLSWHFYFLLNQDTVCTQSLPIN